MIQAMFKLFPFVIVSAIITIILSASLIKNKKIMYKIIIIGICVIFIPMFVFMIIAPIDPLTSMFEGLEGIVYVVGFGAAIYLLITIVIQIINSFILMKNDVNDIYVRDIKVQYSPAVLSYLINQKIEKEKDLSATLLNLCAKQVLKIEKNEDNTLKIIDMRNDEEVKKLTVDEKYAYDMFINGITISKINTWKEIIQKEYDKLKFSKQHNITFGHYMMGILAMVFTIFFVYAGLNGKQLNGNMGDLVLKAFVIVFFTAWESIAIYAARTFIRNLLQKGELKEFKDRYSKKGAKEYMKWKKFEKFMEDFTLVKEKDYTSVEVLGQYLSYSIALGINKKCDKEVYEKIKKYYVFDIDIFENI